MKLVDFVSSRPNPSTELVSRDSHVHAVTKIGKLWWRKRVPRRGIINLQIILTIGSSSRRGSWKAKKLPKSTASHLARKGSTSEDDEICVSGTTQVVSHSRVVVDTWRSARLWLSILVVENFTIKTSGENGKVSICESVASEKKASVLTAD